MNCECVENRKPCLKPGISGTLVRSSECLTIQLGRLKIFDRIQILETDFRYNPFSEMVIQLRQTGTGRFIASINIIVKRHVIKKTTFCFVSQCNKCLCNNGFFIILFFLNTKLIANIDHNLSNANKNKSKYTFRVCKNCSC